ncbi:hypothetical protein PACILC2_44560 [Paenibacillus cisolokensis]|uniref:HTH cro/C1-type domain-containing protein n=2 Tax=Paenibacillus cisolokensis TaxID=1658519 RepID=A0ABQ4NCE8_9BACL|nr:hypothetical protein PACILC2_44560 [Paenibacillus cisolokensis]
MIGLEFICKVYRIEYKDLALSIGVSPPSIQDWLKGRRKIPKARIVQLRQIFKSVPEEYFQKELTKSEELHVQQIYFTETDEFEEIEIPFIDDDGVERWHKERYSQNSGIINSLIDKRKNESLIERIRALIDNDEFTENNNHKMVDKYISILEKNKKEEINFLRMVFYYFKNKHEWGFDPFFAASEKEIKMYEEFKELLLNYKIIEPDEPAD